MLSGEGNAGERWKTTIGLISKKATLHVQHTFLYISLPLFCTTTTWNFQKLLRRKCRTCSRSLFFTAAHSHPLFCHAMYSKWYLEVSRLWLFRSLHNCCLVAYFYLLFNIICLFVYFMLTCLHLFVDTDIALILVVAVVVVLCLLSTYVLSVNLASVIVTKPFYDICQNWTHLRWLDWIF